MSENSGFSQVDQGTKSKSPTNPEVSHKKTAQKVKLKCALLNVQGLVTKRVNELFSPELKNVFKNNDTNLLTETWAYDLCDSSVDVLNVFHLMGPKQKE